MGSEEIIHLLFAGETTKSQVHNKYRVRMNNLEETFFCNFQAIDKKIICGTIPALEKGAWVKELEKEKIFLSELKSNSDEEISVLIGADIAGKLMTGKKFDLSNGLTAFETELRWTIMGKNKQVQRIERATEIHSMFVADAKVSDLWRLDILRITDPVEKIERNLNDQIVRDEFLKTVRFNEETVRYTFDLPWKSNYAPVSKNYGVSKNRLENVVKNLKAEGKFQDYDEVFKDCLNEGFIEKVPIEYIDDSAHYLPHRPVFEQNSKTKIRPVFHASAHETGLPSLNQCLETGPNLLELIPSSVLKFRENEIGVIAYDRKAFLQIEINEVHQNFLRFFGIVQRN